MTITHEPLSETEKAKHLGISRMQLWRFREGLADLPAKATRRLASLDRKKKPRSTDRADSTEI